MKMEINAAMAVDLLLSDEYRSWSLSAAEMIVDRLETQERYGYEGSDMFSVESVRESYREYEDGMDWLSQHTGKPWGVSLLLDIDIEVADYLYATDYEIDALILDYIRGKFELLICRYSIVVGEVEF